MEISVYINPQAGSAGEATLSELVQQLKEHGIKVKSNRVAPEYLRVSLQKAVEDGLSLVAICGGDGTLSTAAAALKNSNTVLVPVPTGTLNHFAKRHNIGSVSAAASAIYQALSDKGIVEVSVGEVNGRVFINNTTCGVYPLIVRKREDLRRWLPKWPAAFSAAVLSLIRFPLLDLHVEAKGRVIARRTPILWVGLGRGSFHPFEQDRPNPEDEVLEIVIVRTQSRLGLLLLTARVLLGLRQGRPLSSFTGLEVLHTAHITVHARRRIDTACDGEVIRLHPPLNIRIRPKALRIPTL